MNTKGYTVFSSRRRNMIQPQYSTYNIYKEKKEKTGHAICLFELNCLILYFIYINFSE